MKTRAWTEFKDIRPINTGGEMLEVRKGDLVVVFVVERWDSFDEAVTALRKLYSKDGTP